MWKLVRAALGLAFGSWISAAISGAVILALLGSAYAGYRVWRHSIYHAGEIAERTVWQEKVEKAAAAREQERARAAIEQARLAEELLKTEAALTIAEQEKDDALTRALATADLSVCRIIPDSVLQPFR